MKNFKKISPKRLKKLLLAYQNQIKTYKVNMYAWKNEDKKHYELWIEQLNRNEKQEKKYTIIIIVLSIINIFNAIVIAIS